MTSQAESADTRIPVTVVTGFLGAGKTTLINRILADLTATNVAIIVNEFGDIGIDGELINSGDEELIELNSGCICCVVRGDLIRGLRSLLAEKPGTDLIVIETTGLANPSPVIQTLIMDQVIGAQCRLDSVVCVVDAVHIQDQLSHNDDASNQIAFSDHLILNKVPDARTPVTDIETTLRAHNPLSAITRTSRSDVPAVDVLNRFSFDLDRMETQLSHPANERGHTHVDASGITSVSLTCDAALNAERVEYWLQDLLSRQGADILRTKAILSVEGQKKKLAIQAVNMMLEGAYIGEWKDASRTSRIVFIGRKLNVDTLNEEFQRCRHGITEYA